MTIRARLTIWFSLLLSVVLGVFAFIEYNEAAVRREQYFFQLMRLRALDAANVSVGADDIGPAALEKAKRRFSHSLDEEYIVVYDSLGNIVFKSDSTQQNLLFKNAFLKEVFEQGKIERSVRDTQYYYESHSDGEKYVVAAKAYDTQGYSFLANLRKNLITGFIATVIIITLICWYFAKKALEPVEKMRQKAASISANNLQQRLEIPPERDEVALLGIEFNKLFDRMEATFHSQRQFIANASHEIRTPLAILKSAVEVSLLQPRTTEEYQSILKIVFETTHRLQRLSNDLLYLARAESDLAKLPDTTINFDEVVYAALEQVQQIYPTRTFQNITDLTDDDELFAVHGNAELLHISVVNILDNAAKYSPAEAPVTIHLFKKGKNVHCVIKDSGLGIMQDDYPLIFNLFFRAETVKMLEGNGVGLPLVKSIIERHGGTITVESKADSGTTVSLTLPSVKAL
ncbi:MAG: ATP-binding protein [Bacteroidota bacterium]